MNKYNKEEKNIDFLTGLPTREVFNKDLRKNIVISKKKKRQLALLFINLDRFTSIKDNIGSNAGEMIIKKISKRLKKVINHPNLIYRLGGDEFTIILQNIKDVQLVIYTIECIFQLFEKSFKNNRCEIYLTVSIGISIYPLDGQNTKTLTRNTDIAMCNAKNNGKNTFQFYNPKVNEIIFERVLIETEIKNAINNDEFIILYQPQYNIKKKTLIGAEALIRWNHPNLGLISPVHFVSIAEETGMIVEIGEIVIYKVCSHIVKWRNKGYNPGIIAINLAGEQILDKSLVKKIKTILRKTKCKAEWIELEVTETFIMKNLELAHKNLKKIRKLGINISIDDFGTGYSSLAYLKKLPIDKLKIDKSFINGIPNDNNDKAIIGAIIAMCKKLSLRTIAEGVENENQKKFLLNEGCDSIQGYLYYEPITTKEFKKLINQGIKIKKGG